MTSLINSVVLIILIKTVNAPWWLYILLGGAIAMDFARAFYVFESGKENEDGSRTD